MEFIAQNWRWLAGILTIAVTFGGAFYKFAIRDSVKKSELYEKDGRPIYQHRSDSKEITTSFTECLGEIKETMEAMDKRLQHDRLTASAFMSAVKEKLDLKFTIPKF